MWGVLEVTAMHTKAYAFCMSPGVFLLVKKKQVEILKSADCRIRGSLRFFKIFVCCSHLVAVVVGVLKWLESLREFECLRSSGEGCDFSVCVCVFWECSGMG